MSIDPVPNYDLTRLYLIKGGDESEEFVPGRLASGEQVMIGPVAAELLLGLFFSPDGDLLRQELFPVPYTPDPALLPGQQRAQQGFALQDGVRRWVVGLGMTLGDIRVRHFAFPEWRIGIAEWPLSMFDEVARLTAAGEPLEDEYQIEWKERRCWVLHWNREHWMSPDGEVEAT